MNSEEMEVWSQVRGRVVGQVWDQVERHRIWGQVFDPAWTQITNNIRKWVTYQHNTERRENEESNNRI